jgi:hypothetical protein
MVNEEARSGSQPADADVMETSDLGMDAEGLDGGVTRHPVAGVIPTGGMTADVDGASGPSAETPGAAGGTGVIGVGGGIDDGGTHGGGTAEPPSVEELLEHKHSHDHAG